MRSLRARLDRLERGRWGYGPHEKGHCTCGAAPIWIERGPEAIEQARNADRRCRACGGQRPIEYRDPVCDDELTDDQAAAILTILEEAGVDVWAFLQERGVSEHEVHAA